MSRAMKGCFGRIYTLDPFESVFGGRMEPFIVGGRGKLHILWINSGIDTGY